MTKDHDGQPATLLGAALDKLAEALDFNDNAEVLKFLRRLRPFTELPGKPSTLALMHPTKNAGEDDLVPYGGGSVINELDGNLTVWSSAPYRIKLWRNKVRGPEFEPKHFQIDKLIPTAREPDSLGIPQQPQT